MQFFQELTVTQVLLTAVDFYIAWLLVCIVLKLLKTNIRAVQIVKGVIIICFLNLLSQMLELSLVNILIKDVMTWGILAIVIIFQPEIRTGLEQMGRTSPLKKDVTLKKESAWVLEVLEAVKVLAEERTGALMVLENQVPLRELSEVATPIDAMITSELLRTIFRNKTPLHDGAVIIREERIACAGAILPATNQDDLPQTMGTRHRAALGVSEMSDSLTIVVSEETGQISITKEGQIERYEKYFHFEQAFKQMMERGGSLNEDDTK